jgi:hypothetical protein
MDTFTRLDPDPDRVDAMNPAAFKTRTETLRKYVAQASVDHRMLAENPEETMHLVEHDLRFRLNRCVAKAGRQVHGEVTITQQEDFMRLTIDFRAEAMTRECHDGHWGEVWEAIHQDEDDRIHNIDEDFS